MANGDGIGFLPMLVIAMTSVYYLLKAAEREETGGDERKVILESIDSKMHTHAADGSIQGIGGWY